MSDQETANPAAEDVAAAEQKDEQQGSQPAEGPESSTSPAQEAGLQDIAGDSSGEIEDAADGGGSGGLQMLMDLDLTVTAELGRTRMTIGEVVNLSAGSIVPLSKIAGETIDLRVNDKLLASGEVIVVDGHFAVKITRLLSKEERVKNFS